VVYYGQIYVSTDSGNTWTAKESDRRWLSVAMSADGIIQAAVLDYGQIYVSTDSGNTWTAKGSDRRWRSVAMAADGTKQTAVVFEGQIYVSTDSGNTWIPKESNRYWQSVAMSADGTMQTAVGLIGQIYVSTDTGNTWIAKESNRYWGSVAMSADGTKQTAVTDSGQIYVSTDSGNTWTAKESNRNWRSVAMSADGTKQTAVVRYGQIYVSTDSGNAWKAKESDREWLSVAMSADGTKQTAVVQVGQIYVGQAGSICRIGIGTTSPAYELDVSGSARLAGDMAVEGGIGIGTTEPVAPLHIISPELNAIRMESDDGTSRAFLRTRTGAQQNLEISADNPSTGSHIPILLNRLGGNVGIGTSNPAYELDVSGSARLTGDMAVKGGIGIGTTSPAYELDVWGSARLTGDMAVEDSLGIGTTSPEAMLDVRGNIKVNQKIQAYDSGGLELATDEGTTRIFVADDGKVGIGTLNVEDLEVAGNVKLTGSGNGIVFPDGTKQTTAVVGFPRPAYDSGWCLATALPGETWFHHGVGGDPNNYVVDLQCKNKGGISNYGIGGLDWEGFYYSNLTNSHFRIKNDFDDDLLVRVRIWVYN
jgi:photosystem II stability/assembly factor-like uncharacterized protein